VYVPKYFVNLVCYVKFAVNQSYSVFAKKGKADAPTFKNRGTIMQNGILHRV